MNTMRIPKRVYTAEFREAAVRQVIEAGRASSEVVRSLDISSKTLGNWVLEGLVRWLVGDDPRAAALRREVEFYVYPMVNADGRFAGYNRGGVAWPAGRCGGGAAVRAAAPGGGVRRICWPG